MGATLGRAASLLGAWVLAAAAWAAAAGLPAPVQSGRPHAVTAARAAALPDRSAAGAVSVTDDLGRRVVVQAPARRIVSLAPSNTEILFAIGAGPQVVAVTDFCNFPPEVRRLPRVGGMMAGTVSLERIVSLQPDLVLTVAGLQRPVVEQLQRLGLAAVAVDSTSFAHLYENLRKVGRLTGQESGAERVVQQLQQQVQRVQQATGSLAPQQRLRVFYLVWDEPLMTAGPRSFIGQVLELAGAVNVFADVSQDWPQVSLEELVRRQPDVILAPAVHGGRRLVDQLRSRPGWKELKAVQAGRVYTVDDDLISRPGPRLGQALEQVARVLYPQRFEPEAAAVRPAAGADR